MLLFYVIDCIFVIRCVLLVLLLSLIYRSERSPLTGIFHPWAQWDMGLDTLENSSVAAAAVAALGDFSSKKSFFEKCFSGSLAHG